MNKENILSELKKIFASVLQEENLDLQLSTSMDDIEKWDSLNHARLIDAVEKHYNIKFDLMEMLDVQTVGDICAFALRKTASR